MKTSTKLRIAAASMTIIGVSLIILGTVVFKNEQYNHPNFGIFIPGIFIAFFSLPVWAASFLPNMMKVNTSLQNEALDMAGENISKNIDKTLDVAQEGIKRTVKTVKEGLKDDVEMELIKAKKMFEDGLIDEEEYEALKKKILKL